MIRRWMTVGGLLTLFLAIFVGLASCGIPETIDPQSLQNSMGAANGPGSGQWKPRAPRTGARCQEFHGVLTNLAEESQGLAGRIDELYGRCFDEAGFLLPGADEEGCVRPMNDFMNNLRVRYVDFESGARVYEDACIQAFAEALPLPARSTLLPLLPPRYDPDVADDPGYDESPLKYTWCLTCIDPPPAPDPQPEPEAPEPEEKPTRAPETQDPEDGGGSKCCTCLTCIHGIDVDYTIVEAPVWLPDS